MYFMTLDILICEYIIIQIIQLFHEYMYKIALSEYFLESKVSSLCKIPKFHLISWCGNFMKTHSLRSGSEIKWNYGIFYSVYLR